jgi:hypothetical protein
LNTQAKASAYLPITETFLSDELKNHFASGREIKYHFPDKSKHLLFNQEFMRIYRKVPIGLGILRKIIYSFLSINGGKGFIFYGREKIGFKMLQRKNPLTMDEHISKHFSNNILCLLP